ncbi:restriction endonuclease [Streptomyces sp. NPDC052036]|uniref:restriction endonuclease n=1 Tax=Streptomyces sp. NPDC052036 TaxID=3155171 RepID=UPI0034148086
MEPPPAERPRRTCLHLLHSTASGSSYIDASFSVRDTRPAKTPTSTSVRQQPLTTVHRIMELCVTGGPGDQGADVVAKTYVGGVGAHKYVTQAKRYRATKTVGLTDMARFAVTCFQAHEADTEVRVTTSTFTPSRPRSSPSA